MKIRRLFRYLGVAGVALAVGALGSFLFLTRTGTGQALVLTGLLARVDGIVDGEVTVTRLSSRRLLREVTLHGVSISTTDGRPFFSADSLSAEYDIRDLLTGRFLFAGVELWRPLVSISKRATDAAFNASDVLRLSERGRGQAAAPPSRVRLVLENVTMHDGRVEVGVPVDARAVSRRARTRQAEDGSGLQRRLTFRGINASLARVGIVDPEAEGIRVQVDRWSMWADITDEPLRVTDFKGRVDVRDRRAVVTAESVRLPGTAASGLASVDWADGGAPALRVDVAAPRLALADFRWIDARLPAASGRASLGYEAGPAGRGLRWSRARLDLGDGSLGGQGQVRLDASGRVVSISDVALTLEDFDLARLEPFAERTLPLDGRLTGDLALNGSPDDLLTDGNLTLRRPGGVSHGEFKGNVTLRRPFGVRGLNARFEALEYDVLARLLPGLPLKGSGPVRVEADGRLTDGMSVTVDLGHRGPDGSESRVRARGTLQSVDDDLVVDLQGDLEPLDLDALVRLPEGRLPLGRVAGRVTAVGPLSDLSLSAELGAQAGALILDGRFDLRDPFAGYQLSATATRYALSAVVSDLPDTTTVSGSLTLSGSGRTVASARARGELVLRPSKVGPVRVDTAAVSIRLEGGTLAVDTAWAVVAGIDVRGAGTLAATAEAESGELTLGFEGRSLEGLQGLFFGENMIARDNLSTLERESLLLEGIDVDTLPLSRDIRVGGRLEGSLTLSGGLQALSANGSATLERGVLGKHSVGFADITFDATGLPSRQPQVEVEVAADSLSILERVFASGTGRLVYREPRGTLNLFLARDETEDYLARIAFESDSTQRIVHLDEMGLRFAEERLNLGGPATISWDPEGLTFRDLRVVRPGPGGLRFRANGRYPFDGPASLDLDIERLDLSRVDHLLQLPDTLEGMVNLAMTVGGTAEAPEIKARFRADDFRFRDVSFGALQGDLDFRDQSVTGTVDVMEEDRRVLALTGRAPAHFALDSLGFSIPDLPLDLSVVADTLPLSMLLSLTDGFEDVAGTIHGQVVLGGTAHHPAPFGTLEVRNGGVTIEGLGVRQRDVTATLDLSEDGSVKVNGSARAGGTARVTGTVTLNPATDPAFDLTLALDRYRGVNRRDVTGLLSGEVKLGGTYQSPVVTGRTRVDEGTLFVEEFQRATEVVDLDDDAFLDPVDPSLVDLRPLLGGANPFLRNIRMEDLTLAVARDTWIRSEVMNVELGGELGVLYDRQQQDLAMVGNLEAVRGTYDVLGRQFQVTGGTIQFIGTSGINPNLDIQADNRVRTADGNNFTITAHLTGTLLTPQVNFTSDQAGLDDADLLSYLVFGRPSYAIASGQSAQVRGAASALLGSGLTLGLSTFSNRLGSELARGLGLGVDYLSISQQDLALGAEGTGGTLRTTVVETGWYLADDFFVVLSLRPLAGSRTGSPLAGARFEWAASDSYSIEAFFEDSFFRNRVVGFGELGLQSSTTLGLSLFREWGY